MRRTCRSSARRGGQEKDMVDKILVAFEGEGSGVEELSWGQRGVWRTIVKDGHSSTLGGVVPLPAGSTVTHLVATYLHTTLDADGVNVLLEDLAGLDLKTGQTTSPPPAGLPPMAQARLQRQPRALRQSEASIRHLERVMRAISPNRF